MTADPDTPPGVGAGAEAPTTLGPGSLFWEYMGDYRTGLLAGRAVILQNAHPAVGAATVQLSDYKSDPWGRAMRTQESILRLVYGGSEAVAEGARLRDVHRTIRGTDSQGRRFAALDPEAYAWVHATIFEWIVQCCRLYGKPLTDEQTNQLFGEWRTLGLLLGLRPKDMPDDVEAFWTYFDEMLNDRLEDNEAVQELLADGLIANDPPPGSRISTESWAKRRPKLTESARRTIAATLPRALAQRFGLTTTAKDAKKVKEFAWIVRNAFRVLPESRRFTPEAAAARRAALERAGSD